MPVKIGRLPAGINLVLLLARLLTFALFYCSVPAYAASCHIDYCVTDSIVRPKKSIARLVCVADLSADVLSFGSLGRVMGSNGFDVVAIPLHPHNCCCGTQVNLRETVSDLIASIASYKDDLPIILVGEGFGAAVCLAMLERFPTKISGVIVSFVILPKYRWKQFPSTDRPGFRSSEKIVLNHRSCRDFLNSMKKASCSIPSVPMLFIHGDLDQVVKTEESRKFFESIRTPERSYLEVADTGHFILERGSPLIGLERYRIEEPWRFDPPVTSKNYSNTEPAPLKAVLDWSKGVIEHKRR